MNQSTELAFSGSPVSLARGQIRLLNPLLQSHPLLEGGPAGHSCLVLTVTSPREYSMPEDLTPLPGPCRIVHVLTLGVGHENASRGDVCLPARVTGLDYEVYASLSSLSTIRLDADDPDGSRRFGPLLGGPVDGEFCEFAWLMPTAASRETLLPLLEKLDDYNTGVLVSSPGSVSWRREEEGCVNINRLRGW